MKKSLGLRLIGALLLAFALIAVLVVALNYWVARTQLAEQSAAQQLGGLLVRSLEGVQDRASARAVVQGFATELQRQRQLSGFGLGEAGIELRDAQGEWVLALGPQLPHAPPKGLSRVDLGDQPLAVFRGQGGPWTVQVLDPLPSDAALLKWLLGQVGISLLVALPVLLLTLWLAVRSGLKPLRRFSERMAALDTRKDLQPLGLDLRYAELQPLAQSFDALLARLRERLALERAFVQDAAHELRTPLAALGAQAHLLLNSADDSARAQAAQALQQGLARTAHLSQQLLDLAALDQGHGASQEELDLVELGGWVLRQAHPDARRRSISLALEGPDSLPWRGERGPLQSLLQNLVDNAIRYGAREVELQLGQSADGRPWVQVADDGPGVPPEQQQQMFERFWRGAQNSESGTGLGLAIVAQALRRLEARLQIGAGLAGRGIAFHVGL